MIKQHVSKPRPVAACELRPKNSPWRIVRFVGEAQVRYLVKGRSEPKAYGDWLRKEMTELGPAYVKLGQALSTRSDLIDKSIVKELAKLQDANIPADVNDIRGTIESSLAMGTKHGANMEDIFEWFDDNPIATASIGQVHRGRLRDADHSDVVVKVIKPCVARQIRDDLATLRGLSDVMKRLGSARANEFENLLSQNERFLSAELDYRREARNMIRFHELMEESGAQVIIPRVYEELSSDTILVMEYVPSIKITNTRELRAKGYDTAIIAENLVNVFLQMIATHGFVHCDPHPGNIGVSYNAEDTIVLYDFGNVIELSPEFRKELNNMIFAIYQRDVEEFVELLVRLDILRVTNDAEKLDIQMFFKSFFQYLESLDFATLRKSLSSEDMLSSQESLSKIHINPDLLSLFRVFSLMDGTCVKLDPNFNYISALSPFVENIMMDMSFFDYRARKDLQKLQNYPRIIQNTDQNLVRLDKRVTDMRSNQWAIQNVLIAFVVLQNWNDPWVLMPMLPLLVYMIRSR